jgi:hypothetical protein
VEAVSSEVTLKARKFSSLVMQRLAVLGQNKVADEIGVSAPTVSRWASDDLERACQVLVVLGLKVVINDRVCVDPKMYEALVMIAGKAMSHAETAQRLVWED